MLSSQEVDLVNILSESFKDRVTEDTETIEQRLLERLKDSPLITDYDDIYFCKSFKINNAFEDLHILILKYSYQTRSGRYDLNNSELQIVAIKSLNKSYGNLLIRPETLQDKVIELIISSEIDLEDYPSFSAKYYFVAESESSAYSFATQKRISLIERQKEIVIHVKDDFLIAKYCRSLTDEDFNSMIEFISEI